MDQHYEYIGMKKQEVNQPIAFPSQHQNPPGFEHLMNPRPIFDSPDYVGSGKLKGKVAIITGGDSGFGRAIAVAFAKEGANLTILYLNEHEDAEETKEYVEKLGASCQLLPGDLRDSSTSESAVAHTIKTYQQLDIVVNNAAVQPYTSDIMDVSDEQLDNTFRTNVYPLFYMTKAALPHLKYGSSIISTTSRVAYEVAPTYVYLASNDSAYVTGQILHVNGGLIRYS